MHRSFFGAVVSIAAILGSRFPANAQQAWQTQQIAKSAYPSNIVPEKRRRAPNGLPDGLVAKANGDIKSAWYSEPTKRYAHGILGDAIEAGTLNVKIKTGKVLSIKLPQHEVFEDRYPRLVDLDGDGTTEVITIRSSASKGGGVTVYGLKSGKLVQKTTTPFIGRANRWLNIAGIQSFRGKKSKEIAYVQTPHIGGTLFFLSYNGKTLRKVASMAGFSNHAIGSREMRLSATADVNNDGKPDLAVPSADRRQLRMVGFSSGKLRDFGHAFLPSQIDKAIAVKKIKGKTNFVVGLRNGEIYQVNK